MSDITVQRFQADIPNTGGSASITAVSDLSKAFVLIGNNRKMSAGPPSNNGSMELDDLAGAMYLSATDSVAILRQSGSLGSDTRFDGEVIEYTGPVGGPNEFTVIGRYSGTVTATNNTTSVTVTAPSDRKKAIPIITGIISSENTDGGARGTAICLMNSDTNVVVYAGGSASDVTIYFTLVEFTGSNWEVAHGGTTSTADTGTITLVEESTGNPAGTPKDIGDWSTALIFPQHRGDPGSDTNQAIADNWPVLSPGADTSSVSFTFNSQRDGTNNFNYCHVLKNSEMDVQRMTDTQSLEGAMNVTITSTLSDITKACVVASRYSSGTGTAYGRGWVNYRLTSTSNVELWAHRSGNTISTNVQVADFSAMATTSRRIFIM
jgi:hypothetical protein